MFCAILTTTNMTTPYNYQARNSSFSTDSQRLYVVRGRTSALGFDGPASSTSVCNKLVLRVHVTTVAS